MPWWNKRNSEAILVGSIDYPVIPPRKHHHLSILEVLPNLGLAAALWPPEVVGCWWCIGPIQVNNKLAGKHAGNCFV